MALAQDQAIPTPADPDLAVPSPDKTREARLTGWPLVVIIDRYPLLEQADVAMELKGLEQRGLRFEIWSLERPGARKTHPIHGEIAARVRYLPRGFAAEPARVLAALLGALFGRGFFAALATALRSMGRAPGSHPILNLLQACVLNAEAAPGLRFAYARNMTASGNVARALARLRDIGWGFHASEPDVWSIPDFETAERLDEAAFVLAPSETVHGNLQGLAPGRDRVLLTRTGLDLGLYSAPLRPVDSRIGETEKDAIRLISVGPLEDRAGYRDLLRALADVPRGLKWRLTHFGDGPLAARLRQYATQLHIAPRILWRGPADQTEVIAAMREADIFVQTPRPGEGMEHGGIPFCLLEAASQKLPILSTRTAAVAQFVIDGETGILVRAGNASALAEAIGRLAHDPAERARLGNAARARVEANHRLGPSLDDLARRLRTAIQAA